MSSSSSFADSDSTSSFLTPSLEFPDRISFREMDLSEAGPSSRDRISFRIQGVEGEIDRINVSPGVFGPDDLAISLEACKKRSFSDSHKVQAQHLSEAGLSGVVVASSSTNQDIAELMPSELSEIGNLSTPVDRVVVDGGTPGTVENRRGIERTPTILVKSKGYLVPNDVVAVGGGIKGVRPPVLKPPPAMKRPPIDLRGSSWDFLTHFAPSETVKRPSSSSSSSENGCDEEEAKEEEVETEETGARFIQLGDTADEACSFTKHEGDSSSTVSNTSPIYPDGGSIITSWQKGQLLGRGSFGSVYEGISGDGDFFAVMEVSLLDQAQECIQQLEGEIALFSQLQHQNIVRYRDTAKDGSNLYIFLELDTQGSLLKLYQRYQLRESVVSVYTRQILDGLKYLHNKGFIHRDIKCANILVDTNGAAKLADFGLGKVSKFNDIKSCMGTPFWMAPEVINRKDSDGYGSPVDIWSLGCTVLEMCTGQIPYSDLEPVQALFRIGRGTLPEVPETLSLDARHFILKCLKVNPEERPTAAELLNHPFVRRPLPSMGSGGSEAQEALTIHLADVHNLLAVRWSSSSSSSVNSESTCSFLTPSLGFPDRISFREMDLSKAGPSGTVLNRENIELTRSESIEIRHFSNPEDMVLVTSWLKGQLPGRGSFGSIYEGMSIDGDFFAVSEVSLLDQGSQAQECIHQLEAETTLLSQLQHHNIMSSSSSIADSDSTCSFMTPSLEFPDRISFREMDLSVADMNIRVPPSRSRFEIVEVE